MSKMPLVFIIGDSISMGYTPHVRRQLEGRARIERHEGNGGDSHNLLSNLASAWLPTLGERPDLLHINCGLHDLRFWTEKDEYQVPLESYRKNMVLLASALSAGDATVVWCTTTPVIDGAPNMSKSFPRRNADVDAYNAAALEVMTSAGFAINDLNAYVKRLGPDKLITPDGVHFSDEGYSQLGTEAARVITEALDA